MVWSQCLNYFDPEKDRITYTLYAPIWGLSGVNRRKSLGDGLEIRKLQTGYMAKIASLDESLAGVATAHRFTLWPVQYFVKAFEFQKHVGSEEDRNKVMDGPLDCTAWLNEEVAFLRALLSEEIAVPGYAFIYDGYPRDGNVGRRDTLPWRPHRSFVERRLSSQQIAQYARNRTRFKGLVGRPGWPEVAGSMRRFAIAWENPFPADSLADIIAALEGLLVREKGEVSYKLRVRTAHLLAGEPKSRQRILKDVRDGYAYRSRITHGDYVFDDQREWDTAKALKRAKGKGGNPFHDFNEVHRLKYVLAGYYRAALIKLIRSGRFEVDWTERGL